MHADVTVVGAGLAELLAAAELVEAGKSVVLVGQESEQNRGGQAFWSFGRLFLVDSPQQRRLGIKDSVELAIRTGGAARSSIATRTGGRVGGPRPTSTSQPARSTPGSRSAAAPPLARRAEPGH